MINKETKITKAECDVCKKDLVDRVTGSDNVNRGILKHQFGYGSTLDNPEAMAGTMISFDLCEKCFSRAIAHLDLLSQLSPYMIEQVKDVLAECGHKRCDKEEKR